MNPRSDISPLYFPSNAALGLGPPWAYFVEERNERIRCKFWYATAEQHYGGFGVGRSVVIFFSLL